MILPDWFIPGLIGIDVLVMIYGLQVAFNEKKVYGWFLALAFFIFGIKEILPFNGLNLPNAIGTALTITGLAFALCAFYLLIKSLPS